MYWSWRIKQIISQVNYQPDVRNCNILCFTKTWLTHCIPYNSIQPEESLSFHHTCKTDESGKKKTGGINFMVNSNWCYNRRIQTFFAVCSTRNSNQKNILNTFYHGSFPQSSSPLCTPNHRQVQKQL